jgi:Uma2 family endonuclease
MMSTIALPAEPLELNLGAGIRLDDAELFALCAANPDLRIERTAKGDVTVMTPAGGRSAFRELYVGSALMAWAVSTRGLYVAFSPSAGFVLPNGAKKSPDAACVLASRLAGRGDLNERFLPVCPDLVVEVRSAHDDLRPLLDKMEEYRDNGARLGWLIDPYDARGHRVHVYRPGVLPESLARDPRGSRLAERRPGVPGTAHRARTCLGYALLTRGRMPPDRRSC